MTIEYTKVGDYYFLNLNMDKQEQIKISKYGRMKLQYLKNHQQGLYHKLLANNELNDYLLLVDKEVNELYEKLFADFNKRINISEELKGKNQILWVKEMNNMHSCINEIIQKKLSISKLKNGVSQYFLWYIIFLLHTLD